LDARDEVRGDWRKQHKEELYDLYCSSNIVWVTRSKQIRLAGHVAHMGNRVLVGRHDGRRSIERPKHRWEDNIKIDLRDVGWGGMD
jgi:hypothetical protein